MTTRCLGPVTSSIERSLRNRPVTDTRGLREGSLLENKPYNRQTPIEVGRATVVAMRAGTPHMF